jgi:hypothetical protein
MSNSAILGFCKQFHRYANETAYLEHLACFINVCFGGEIKFVLTPTVINKRILYMTFEPDEQSDDSSDRENDKLYCSAIWQDC